MTLLRRSLLQVPFAAALAETALAQAPDMAAITAAALTDRPMLLTMAQQMAPEPSAPGNPGVLAKFVICTGTVFGAVL